MREQDIPLEIPERVLQTHEGRLPLVQNFKISYDFEKVFIPATTLVTSQRARSVVDFRFLVENARDQDDSDRVVRSSFAPSGKESWQEGVHDFFVIALPVPCKLPEFSADLNENSDFGREGSVYHLG